MDLTKALLVNFIFIKPGPADSALSISSSLLSSAVRFFDNSFGFTFNAPAAIIQTFDVMWPLLRLSVIEVVYLLLTFK